jgi:hypothetical protein
MKKITAICTAIILILFSSCGDGGGKKGKVELSEKGKLLTSVIWKYDTNASIKGTTDAIEDTTGISADIKLEKDVKKIADFFTGTLRFAIDAKDPSLLSYERKYGKGIFSSSVLGYWEFAHDEKFIIMREWDDAAGKEKPPVEYQIVELTADKLILKEPDGTEHFYVPN